MRRAADRVVVREHTDALALDADMLVVACGASSPVAAKLGVELPVRAAGPALADVGPVEALPAGLPMTIEENGFHFRRVGTELIRLAMAEPTLRWDGPAEVRDDLVEDWRERLAHRYPRAAGAPLRRAWAGFYDMTPDAHPIIGRASPTASMPRAASPAWLHAVAGSRGRRRGGGAAGRGAAVRPLPYRLERFAGDEIFPETLVLAD